MKTAQSLATIVFLMAIFFGFASQVLGQAEAPPVQPEQQGSLERVPATAGYYISTMNHQALLDRLWESNAWDSLRSTDVGKGMRKAYRRGKSRGYEEYNEDNPFALYLKGYGDTVGSVVFQSAWQVAKEVVGNELFFYVDNDAVAFNRALSKFQLSVMEAMPEESPAADDAAKEEFMEKLALLIKEHFADADCPTMIMGARLNDPDEFRGMIELLRSIGEQGIRSVPEELRWVKKLWNVVDEEDHYLMAIDINMTDVPMEDLLEAIDSPGAEQVLEAIGKEKTASFVLGIVDDLLMLGMASDKQKLIDFGSSPLLIDTPFAAKLRAAIDDGETVVNVAYVSKEFVAGSASPEQILDSWKYFVKTIVKAIDVDGEMDRAKVIREANALIEEFNSDVRKLIPTPGAMIAFSSLQEDGIRMSAISQTKLKTWDASKQLELANHVGPDTVAFIAQRPQGLIEFYDFASKWSAKSFDIFQSLGKDSLIDGVETYLENNSDAEDEAEGTAEENATRVVEDLLGKVERLSSRFDTVTRKRLLPAIDGQEIGLFVDMVSGPELWCEDMLQASQLLPLPLPAIVIGHSDSEKVIEAGARYLGVINDGVRLTLDTIEEFDPQNADDDSPFRFLPPERIEDDSDVSFRWSMLMDHFRAHETLRTGTRVSKDWLVMNFHEGQAKQLTKAKDAGALFGPAQTDDPSLLIAFFDNRVLMEGSRKWFKYALSFYEDPFDMSKYEAERDTLQFTETQMREAVDSVWAVAECFKGVSMRSWEVSEGTATEILMKFEDTGP